MIAINVNQIQRVHVRFEGHSYDVNAAEFNLGPQPNDAEVRLALARNLIGLVVAIGSETIVRYVLDGVQENRSVTLRDLKINRESS